MAVFGTRPEAVKMAPVVKKLAETEGIQSLVCVTAQHREMLDQVLNIFEITPDIDLNLMQSDQSLAKITSAVFTHLDPILTKYKPDWVLAQGDTTTVMAASLLSYYHRIRFGHVEAGLRTGDKWQPFPEEINRQVAGIVADLHFAPTEWARQNLLKENIPAEKVTVTGNPVVDALQVVMKQPDSPEIQDLLQRIGLCNDREMDSKKQSPWLVFVTAHRRENFGEPIIRICEALRSLANHYGDRIRIVYPVHLNPNVKEPVYRVLGGVENITLIPPLDYLSLVHLLKRSRLVLTDSGGIQEEAPGLGVPVLVMRNVTERPEGIDAGIARLVGTNPSRIISEARLLLDDERMHSAMVRAVNPYGDGKAAGRIVQGILDLEG
jgi:UDP-N-acetylglucosamine 2-epimerase (non-hydrolysing)